MFQDICFPDKNEKEFVEVALKLGTKALIFVYEYKDKKIYEKQKKELEKIKEVKAEIGLLVDSKTISKVPNTQDYVLCRTPSRPLVENKKSYILYDFEIQEKPDFMHHKNSGLNHVLCAIMKKNEKILGFSFSSLLNSKDKGVLLGRMGQNAKLSKKYKLNTIAASFAKDPYDLRAEHEIKSFSKIIGI